MKVIATRRVHRLLAASMLVLNLSAGLLALPAGAAEALQMPALPTALVQAKPLSLLPANPAQAFSLRDHVNTGDSRASFKPVGELLGRPVFLADNPKGSANYDGVQVRWTSTQPVEKGDLLFARFAARAIKARQESGEAEGAFFFQRLTGASNRAIQTFSVGPDWTVINVPLVVVDDAAAGEAGISISFAHLEQRFEIAGLEVYHFGKRLTRADLPITRFSYYGREPDAAWRKAALQRIEAIRTAPLSLQVVDGAGRPVPGAQVSAQMTRSEFLWGSAVSAEHLTAQGPDEDRYRQAVVELFDTAVIENGLKWPRWRQPAYRERALQSLDWLLAQNKRVKGHNLAWPAWKFSPDDIAKDPEARRNIATLVEDHIRDITAATQGKLIGWDVVNEPVHETDYFAHMPRERVAHWFKLAEKSDPKLQLTLNEYAMLNRSSSPLFIAEFKAFAAMLRKEGARIDVLGVQGHVGQTPRPPVEVLKDLDLLAEGGNQVQVTEFDFNTTDEPLQADYTRDFLIALYSHKAATGFIQWGFWQGAHWKPDAAMYRKDWSEKPSLQVWKDLVLGAWKTRISQVTPTSGEISARGHRGRYLVTASHGGKQARAEVDLGEGGARVVLKLQ